MVNGSVDTSPGPAPVAAAPDIGLQPPLQTLSRRVSDRLHALKDGDTFVVADAFGDIIGQGDGVFHNDTRVLSRWRLVVGNQRPSLLSAAISHDNVFFAAHMTNRPLPPLGGRPIPEGVIHLERTRFLQTDGVYERLRLVNFSERDATIPIRFEFDADFRDMFEVRGTSRTVRGQLLEPQLGHDHVVFRYMGLDGIMRTTTVALSGDPSMLPPGSAEFSVSLGPYRAGEILVAVRVDGSPSPPQRSDYRRCAAQARWTMRARIRRGATPRSSSQVYNEWLQKSRADIALLTSDLPTGPYPYAGIPWFSAAFGRDAIITAMQTLWLDSGLARGVLSFLAQHQATQTSSFEDSAPGKIMHETRKGEMTATRELPFGRYYGSVDTTPLFIMLAGAYAVRTGDTSFIGQLWPSLLAAMSWIENMADRHPAKFIAYERGEASGLVNQGWKDSENSIFHADGSFPEGPIALVEVQGYAYAAYSVMAELARTHADEASSRRWRQRSIDLRSAVERHFWMPEHQFYGIALDGSGKLCRVKASNVGHLLATGLPNATRARHCARWLLSHGFDSGWGVRTLCHGEAHFNPMSYHNGSVWPHDTALCASGLARYGERDGTARLSSHIFEAAVRFGMRLPELYCGFPRAAGQPPIEYPVACLPQAWAAGSAFMLLQACLGLAIDGARSRIFISQPRLPTGVEHLRIENLAVGDHSVGLQFHRVADSVTASCDGERCEEVELLVRL